MCVSRDIVCVYEARRKAGPRPGWLADKEKRCHELETKLSEARQTIFMLEERNKQLEMQLREYGGLPQLAIEVGPSGPTLLKVDLKEDASMKPCKRARPVSTVKIEEIPTKDECTVMQEILMIPEKGASDINEAVLDPHRESPLSLDVLWDDLFPWTEEGTEKTISLRRDSSWRSLLPCTWEEAENKSTSLRRDSSWRFDATLGLEESDYQGDSESYYRVELRHGSS